jgi:hypothetical protein
MRRNQDTTFFTGRGISGAFARPSSSPYVAEKCMELNGIDEYINFGQPAALLLGVADATLSAWHKGSTPGKQGSFYSNRNNSSIGLWFGTHHVGGTAGKAAAQVSSNGALFADVFSDIAITDGAWHNVIVCLDRDGLMSMYVDDVLQADTTDISAIGSLNSGHDIHVGKEGFWDNYMAARITNLAQWDRLLTADERTAVYNGGAPNKLSALSSSGNLSGWWKYGDDPNDDATATTGQITDQVSTNNGTPLGTDGDEFKVDAPTA